MNIPADLLYTKEHEWVRVVGDTAYVGITDFAQEQLGDIVFFEIETKGEEFSIGDTFGTVEAVKTVSDMFMPVSGIVEEVNPELEDNPEIANSDSYGKGWIIKIAIKNPAELDELLKPEEYQKQIV